MKTPRLPLAVRIALAAGLFIFGGLVACWDWATEEQDPGEDNGPTW